MDRLEDAVDLSPPRLMLLNDDHAFAYTGQALLELDCM